MIQMNLHQISAVVGGNFVGKEARIQGVTTDSRGDCQGKLIIALKGDFFDGEDYCQAAVENGAAAVLVANAVEVDVPQLIVKDTLVSLQAIATAWIKQTGVKVIGVTGSNGKTTVKNMLLAVLNQKYKCFATRGNYNNEIGVPLSILAVSQDDEVAVIEMGAAQVGDIAHLTEVIKPDIAVITNIGDAHIGRFGGVDNIAKGKSEIYQALDHDGLAVINADSPYAEDFMAQVNNQVKSNVITFGESTQADTRLVETTSGYQIMTRDSEKIELNLPVSGKHNYMNAAAVIAIASSMNLTSAEITAGFNEFKPEAGRLETVVVNNQLVVINDAYNANPASVNAAIEVLKKQNKPTYLVLGYMGELGEYAEQMHRKVALNAVQAGIDQILAVGEFAEVMCDSSKQENAHYNCHSFKDVSTLMQYFKTNNPEKGTYLVKGSRSMRLERVVTLLTETQQAGAVA